MMLAKRIYAAGAQRIASMPSIEAFLARAAGKNPYGRERWLASLFAIHDPVRMIALDCPWWNVHATSKVAEFLAMRPVARVFEYGSGASTGWLARRAKEVTSVEHHGDWFALMQSQLRSFGNVDLRYRALEGDAYARAIGEVEGQFDLIVIDGRRRADCLEQSVNRLKPDGIILFDDSGRRRYRGAIANCGLTEDRHFGLSYCVPYPDFSSILHG